MNIPRSVREALDAFDKEHVGLQKGPLSLVVTLTRRASQLKFPIDPVSFETASGGQVAGLGGAKLKSILKQHGIDRVLSSEGGRTSRGNMERMRAYISLLNNIALDPAFEIASIELYWIGRIRSYFASTPFVVRIDPTRSIRIMVRELFFQALARQRQSPGTMYVGAMMQHLVGAKLELLAPHAVEHHGFSVADAPSSRKGDFFFGDVALHVTTAPSEALMAKCRSNLSVGIKPLIVTTVDGVGGARALAQNAGIEERIELLDIEQFLIANIHERGGFSAGGRRTIISEIIERYNNIIEKEESDPSMKIAFEE
jgi:transposase InsO family protein